MARDYGFHVTRSAPRSVREFWPCFQTGFTTVDEAANAARQELQRRGDRYMRADIVRAPLNPEDRSDPEAWMYVGDLITTRDL